MTRPDVSIVIPLYNKWSLTKGCLESLAANPPGEGASFEVIVVDNASSDETPARCAALGEALFPGRFTYERFETNRNFGPACNHGATLAKASRVLFLNNDAVVTPDWLAPLLARLARAQTERPAVGAVGPLLLYPERYPDDEFQGPITPGAVQHLGVTFHPGNKVSHLFSNIPGGSRLARAPRVFQAITAAALLIPGKLFQAMGGFFPGFVNGFEDVDLCLRLKERGVATAVEPKSVVIHLESQSPGRHASEAANSELLTSRCGRLLEPDSHLFAEKSGLEIRIAGGLLLYMVRPESFHLEALRRFSGPLDLVRLWDYLLVEEPLWEQGYGLLGKNLEAAGATSDAARIYFQRYQHFPTQENAEAFARTARMAADPALLRLGAEILEAHALNRKRIEDRIGRCFVNASFYQSIGWERERRMFMAALAEALADKQAMTQAACPSQTP